MGPFHSRLQLAAKGGRRLSLVMPPTKILGEIMDADVKKKWVEALRSGDYKQGRAMLRPSKDRYCCLGVLCEVLEIEYPMNRYNLPYRALVLSGLSAESPTVVKDGTTVSLALLNDGFDGKESLSFPEIADLIEEQL